jgi:hypothetical protein
LSAIDTWAWALSTFAIKSGKWYFGKLRIRMVGKTILFVGIAKATTPKSSLNYNLDHGLSDSYNVYGYTSFSGNKEGQGSIR